MFITGPDVIKTVTHEDVSKQDLGGAMTHNATSGVAHFVARTTGMPGHDSRADEFSSAQESGRRPATRHPRSHRSRRRRRSIPWFPPTPCSRTTSKDVIHAVADDHYFSEVHEHFAKNLVVGFARPEGRPVGVVAETHPFLSPNDEFANFERWDKGNLDLSELKKPEMLEFEYARSALKLGLKLEGELGVNPYKFGMIGSTDAHTGLAAVEENNFFGKTTSSEPSPERATHPFVKTDKAVIMGWETTASGYAAVWALENTRESIFDAMERRETYATTGPRMIVRFFGGYDFDASDANTRSPAVIGYTEGVPMGADLGPAPAGKAPTFLVAALKDSIGANLDRYQIVKGWVDANGDMHEKVYDVVWSGNRKPDADGKVPPVGSTVDVANATWTNTIGAPN